MESCRHWRIWLGIALYAAAAVWGVLAPHHAPEMLLFAPLLIAAGVLIAWGRIRGAR